MNLEDYLKSIGRLKNDVIVPSSIQIIDEQSIQVEDVTPLNTVGDIFDYFYKKGYKSLPAGIQINAENWKGNT